MKCVICRASFKAERADALTCSGRCRVAYHRWLREITPPWPEGVFDLVMVDLPLSFVTYSPKGEGRSPQARYAMLEPRTCIRLLRPLLKAVMAKDSISAWWVYGPRAEPGREARFRVALGQIITGCGFTFTNELLTWIKVDEIGTGALEGWVRPGAFGTGKSTRKGVENVWDAKRGKGIPIRDHSVDQRIFAPRMGHSEKPDEAYRRLEQLYGDVRRLELFGTKLRSNWTVWGHIEGSEFVARLRERGLLRSPPVALEATHQDTTAGRRL